MEYECLSRDALPSQPAERAIGTTAGIARRRFRKAGRAGPAGRGPRDISLMASRYGKATNEKDRACAASVRRMRSHSNGCGACSGANTCGWTGLSVRSGAGAMHWSQRRAMHWRRCWSAPNACIRSVRRPAGEQHLGGDSAFRTGISDACLPAGCSTRLSPARGQTGR